MKNSPQINFYMPDIFNNINVYDIILISIEAIDTDRALKSKIEKHYKSDFYLPKEVYPKQGEILLHKFPSVTFISPLLYIFSFNIEQLDNQNIIFKLFENINAVITEEINGIGFQIQNINNSAEFKGKIQQFTGKLKGVRELTFHSESFVNIEDINVNSPSIFVSYDHENDADYFNKTRESLSQYKINTFDYGYSSSRKIYYNELEIQIKESKVFICIYSNSYKQNRSLRSELELAKKLNKPILIVKLHENIIINNEYTDNTIVELGKDNINDAINKVIGKDKVINNKTNYWWLTSSTYNPINYSDLFSNLKKLSPGIKGTDRLLICYEKDHSIIAEGEVIEIDYKKQIPKVTSRIIREFQPLIVLKDEFIRKNDLLNLSGSKIGDYILLKDKIVHLVMDYIDKNEIKLIYAPIAGFNNDSAILGQDDQLGITYDVQALARLIAYRDLQPPLSIALFGNWGSGKSFFMVKLQEEIKSISKRANEVEIPVCKAIAHIEFNAWHYMDANLWASFVFHIFDKLNEACGNLSAEQRKEIDLYRNLASCEELTKEAKIRKDEAENNYNTLKSELEKLIQDKADKESEFSLKFSDALEITSETITSNEDLKELLNNLGISNISKLTFGISKKIVADLSTTSRVFISAIKKSLRLKKNIFLIGLIFIISGGLCWFLIKYLTINSIWLKSIISYGLSSVALFGSWYNRVVTPQLKRIKSAVLTLETINQEVERKKEESLHKLKLEIEKIELVLQSSTIILQEKRRDLTEADQNLSNIQSEIDSHKHSKLLAGYIQQRLDSDDYKKQLGIISMIRRDFESLSDLLTSTENANKSKPFERIVLYIDDLDRCPEERVVQVLEAIHLLLAFPLFVVIVGVDPRWLSNALKEKYPKFLNEGLSYMNKEVNNQNNNATTLDYLEKIFQLPIFLKHVNEEGSKKLVDSILLGDISKDYKQTLSNKIKQSIDIDFGIDHGEAENQTPNYKNSGFIKDSNFVKDPKTNISENKSVEPSSKEEMENQKSIESYRKLQITQDEIDFIKSISFLIGETPRAVKRFINTYRLIRSHEDFAKAADNPDNLKGIIVFLALANNHNPELRQLVYNWAKDAQLLKKPDFKLFSNSEKEIIKKVKLLDNQDYIQQILRYSFHFES